MATTPPLWKSCRLSSGCPGFQRRSPWKVTPSPKALLVHPSAGPLCLTLLFQGDPDQGVADEVRVLLGQWWRQLRANGDSSGFYGSIQMWLLGWRQFYGL